MKCSSCLNGHNCIILIEILPITVLVESGSGFLRVFCVVIVCVLPWFSLFLFCFIVCLFVALEFLAYAPQCYEPLYFVLC